MLACHTAAHTPDATQPTGRPVQQLPPPPPRHPRLLDDNALIQSGQKHRFVCACVIKLVSLAPTAAERGSQCYRREQVGAAEQHTWQVCSKSWQKKKEPVEQTATAAAAAAPRMQLHACRQGEMPKVWEHAG
jgi:hypothetical protein